jgi:cytochrome c nitrite reductase small subunit
MGEPTVPEKPPSRLRRALAAVPLWSWLLLFGVIGGIVGLGGFTFVYAEGASYFSNDPAACVNCHIMQDVYDGWNHGSHKAVAGLQRLPHPHTFLEKYHDQGA